jgi:hypothetical protein
MMIRKAMMYQLNQSDAFYTGSFTVEQMARQAALRLYRRAWMSGWLWRVWARLTGQQATLYAPVQRMGESQHPGGLYTIALEAIQGSEDRGDDFDGRFHPWQGHSRERWLSVASARLRGLALPPIVLVEQDGRFYVRDGHHRISVARALGEGYIEAEVR